jgi:MFS family permease
MAAANFFVVSSFGAFFLFPLFVAHHGGAGRDIGILMGAMALSSVLCRPWISEIIDGMGRKRSYTLGAVLMTLMPLSYLTFQGPLESFYVPLLIVRVLHGVGMAFCYTAVFTYVADIVPKERLNEGIGMFGVSGLSGLAFGPTLGEAVIDHFGFGAFFMTASALAAVGLGLQLPLADSYAPLPAEPERPSFFSVLKRRKTILVAALAFLFGVGLAASGGFVSPFAKQKGLAFISLYYIAYSTAAIVIRPFGGRLADRFGEGRLLPYALVLTASGLLVMTLLGGAGILLTAGLFMGCGHGLLFPTLNTLAIRGEAPEVRGKVTGVFTGGIDLGSFLGSVVLGYIGDWAGYRALFAAAGLAVLSGLGLGKIRRDVPQEVRPEGV